MAAARRPLPDPYMATAPFVADAEEAEEADLELVVKAATDPEELEADTASVVVVAVLKHL